MSQLIETLFMVNIPNPQRWPIIIPQCTHNLEGIVPEAFRKFAKLTDQYVNIKGRKQHTKPPIPFYLYEWVNVCGEIMLTVDGLFKGTEWYWIQVPLKSAVIQMIERDVAVLKGEQISR